MIERTEERLCVDRREVPSATIAELKFLDPPILDLRAGSANLNRSISGVSA